MIYCDPTELAKNTRLQDDAIKMVTSLPGLESATGADFLITAMSEPALTDLTKIPQRFQAKRHFEHGACLVQRKSGGDFVGSVRDLKEIQLRMLEYAPPGAVRLLVTSIDTQPNGKLQSGGKKFDMTYAAMIRAFTFWEARGGSVSLLEDDTQIAPWLEMLCEVVAEIRLNPIRYVDHNRPSQRLEREAENWVTTGRAFPPGFGRAKRAEIATAIGKDKVPALIEALAWAADPVTAKATHGVGPKLRDSLRDWLGLSKHQRIVYPTWANITVALPGDTKLPLIEDQWERLPDGTISATFTPEQAEICLSFLKAGDIP